MVESWKPLVEAMKKLTWDGSGCVPPCDRIPGRGYRSRYRQRHVELAPKELDNPRVSRAWSGQEVALQCMLQMQGQWHSASRMPARCVNIAIVEYRGAESFLLLF
jgi:hypothetical protein